MRLALRGVIFGFGLLCAAMAAAEREADIRYAYSGEGYNLLQFVLEKGLGMDVGREMERRVFERQRPDIVGRLQPN